MVNFVSGRRRLLPASAALLLSFCALGAQAEDAEILERYAAYEQATRSGDYDAAVAPIATALERAEALYDEDHETVALLSYHYGRALFRKGQWRDAYQALEVARERYGQAFGEASSDMVTVTLGLGDAADTSGVARRHYEEAARLSESVNGASSVAHARVLLKGGVGLVETHRADTDAGMLEKAREVLAATDASSVLRAEAAMQLGKLRLIQGRIDSAEALSLETISLDDSALVAPAHSLLVRIYESRGESDAATPHALAVGRLSSERDGNEDYLPLFRMAPMYPMNALRAGKTGYVDLMFTVDENGYPRDIKATAGEELATFRAAATKAARAFRYAPRFKDGVPVATQGVGTRIRFEIER
ncbi:MAG: TonB family protein [Pseudomonadota bacterium]